MRIVAKTDIGLKRSSNQDSYAAGELPGSVAWAVVCDGMGGVAGGNLASTTAVKIISERISSTYRQGMGFNSIRNMLTSAITAESERIFGECVTQSEKAMALNRKIDKFVCGKFTGSLLMLLTLFSVLWLTISAANYPSELLNRFFTANMNCCIV